MYNTPHIRCAYLRELAQLSCIGLVTLPFIISDNGLDLILPTLHSLLWFRRRRGKSFYQNSRQAIAKCFKIRLFLGRDHQY